jgi:hypothetical protein
LTPSLTYGISLTVLAFLAGLAILPVFGRFSDTAGLTLAKRKIRAALYEFRLFGDEPRLVFRAQRQLLYWNAHYLGLILRPAAIVLVPMLLLLMQMDILYSHRALRVGESAIVSARIADDVNLTAVDPQLQATGAAVESPAVRIPGEHRVLWKVRAVDAGRDLLSLEIPANSGALDPAEKSLQVGSGLHYLSNERVASFRDWLLDPAEPRLSASGPVRSIAVQYPDADFRIFSFTMPWIVWFVIVSWGTMFALRKRFGVVI